MVNVIGLGYIGLPTALMMAAHGEAVAGTDRNADLVARLNAGQVTFREEGLEELFSQAQAAGITSLPLMKRPAGKWMPGLCWQRFGRFCVFAPRAL